MSARVSVKEVTGANEAAQKLPSKTDSGESVMKFIASSLSYHVQPV